MDRKITCLLIDDDIDDQEIFTYAVTQLNKTIEVKISSGGEEALQMLQPDNHFIPDYIFLDLNMPVMHGKECLKAIRQQVHLNKVPVIIYSTSFLDKDIYDTKQSGANGFITKQTSIDQLRKILTDVFSKIKLEQV